MAKDRNPKPKAKPFYDVASLAVLHHAHGNIACTVYPLPDKANAAKWRAAIKSLIDIGLLSDSGAEPVLTAKGSNICRALAANRWRWR